MMRIAYTAIPKNLKPDPLTNGLPCRIVCTSAARSTPGAIEIGYGKPTGAPGEFRVDRISGANSGSGLCGSRRPQSRRRTMSRETTYAGMVGDWQKLLVTL